MNKIFFFIPDLNGGGAERALVNLLNNWPTDEKFDLEPSLVVRCWQGAYIGEIPESLHRIVLGTERSGMRATISTVFKLGRELIRYRPLAIIAFLSAPAVYLSVKLFHPRCKVILSLQTPPAQWLSNEKGCSRRLVKLVQGFVFRHADYLLPISAGIAGELSEIYGLSGSTIKIMHNSVDLEMIKRESHGECPAELSKGEGNFRIITAGRLLREKNQKILIEAVAKLLGLGKKVDLFILGQGPDRAFLEETADRLGIRLQVHFLGFQRNPWLYFRHADLFVLSSNYEGFANVIIEAMACGLPVVSTDAPHGPREILMHGEIGLLVPVGDSSTMAQAIQQLIDNEDQRLEFANKGLKRAKDFDIRIISSRFTETLKAYLLPDENLQAHSKK